MEILSEKELAKRVNVSPWTVRNWRLNEGLPCVKTGSGRIHYSMESFQSWWAEKETANTEVAASTSGIHQIN